MKAPKELSAYDHSEDLPRVKVDGRDALMLERFDWQWNPNTKAFWQKQ
ncbi:hypothetical protein [Limnohabitans sp. 2KL-51]|nr:hypothetical protein [Limnohabitans sp. 2KL-51]